MDDFGGGSSRPQMLFKTLRRLHGQNLDHQGLNDLSEAFQNFVTRARFFNVGRLRRTWSHSAVEFMKYRRRLPALMADEAAGSGNVEDDVFDDSASHKSFKTKIDERKIVVGNVSHRVTTNQLSSFFSKFGKVSSCHIPLEGGCQSMYATLPKNRRSKGIAHITFKNVEGAERARTASEDELKFYDKVMIVTPYHLYKAPRRHSGNTLVADMYGSVYSGSTESFDDDGISVASSDFSQTTDMPESPLCHSATTKGYIGQATFNHFPDKVVLNIFTHLSPFDRVRVERVSKKFLELSVKSWNTTTSLRFTADQLSNSRKPLRNSVLRAILVRCGIYLRKLDLSRTTHFLDDQSLEIVAKECPNLLEIDLTGLKVRWTALKQFAESRQSLQAIAFRNQVALGEKSFWYLFRNCGNLKRVDLRGCRRLHGRCFRLLGLFLEEVLLDGCVRLEPQAIEEICLKSVNVRTLRLNGCYRLTDESINLISRSLGDLQAFTLCGDGFKDITTTGLMNLDRMDRLVELRLDNNHAVSDTLIGALVSGAPGLKIFSLAHAGSDTALTSKGLVAISHLPDLEELDLCHLAGVSNAVLTAIAKNCAKLVSIKLRSCTYVGDDGVIALATCHRLQEIDVSGCLLVSNRAIQAVLNAFPVNIKLTELDSTPKRRAPLVAVTLVVGGTLCDPGKLKMKGSRVVLDTSDYSRLTADVRGMFFAAMSNAADEAASGETYSDDDLCSDDEFESLTAQ
uniref:RNA-binding protein EEED8.10 n=1 Tax=Plectus sambesii TaxID=2011161 RepID=A0A914VZB0_9BILA